MTWIAGAALAVVLVPYFIPILSPSALESFAEWYADIPLLLAEKGYPEEDIGQIICPWKSARRRQMRLVREDSRNALAEVLASVDARLSRENNRIDVLMLSGGEPTLHPEFEAILAYAMSQPIDYVQINTNGVRLAHDRARVDPGGQRGLARDRGGREIGR